MVTIFSQIGSIIGTAIENVKTHAENYVDATFAVLEDYRVKMDAMLADGFTEEELKV